MVELEPPKGVLYISFGAVAIRRTILSNCLMRESDVASCSTILASARATSARQSLRTRFRAISGQVGGWVHEWAGA